MPRVHFANHSPERETDMKDFNFDTTSAADHNMLRISPNEFISFGTDDGKETVVEMQCISKYPVTYKIQTTSPEKFRVRPRCGVLTPDEKTTVNIVLKPEHRLQDGAKDKFLVMCMQAPRDATMTPQQISDAWKQKPSNSPDVEQHRLCCVYKGSEDVWKNSGGGEVTDSNKDNNLNDLIKQVHKMQGQLRRTERQQYGILFMLLLLAVGVISLLYANYAKSLNKKGMYDRDL